MKPMLPALVLLVALAGLTGCGDQTSDTADDPSSSTSDTTPGSTPPSSSPAGEVIEHPSGADDVVLRVVVAGGFVPSEYAFTTQPRLLLLGDGTLVVTDDRGEGAGRFAPMLQGQATEDQVQQVLALADDAGLLGAPPDYNPDGGNVVTDAPTTAVTINGGGNEREHDAYALGLSAEGDTAARKTLAGFVTEATAMLSDVDTAPYVPDQLRLQVTPVEGELPERSVEVAWPADDVALDAPATCGVVSPADPAAIIDALSDADFTTYFTQGGSAYSVSGRAVLPGEDECADAEAPDDTGDQPR